MKSGKPSISQQRLIQNSYNKNAGTKYSLISYIFGRMGKLHAETEAWTLYLSLDPSFWIRLRTDV